MGKYLLPVGIMPDAGEVSVPVPYFFLSTLLAIFVMPQEEGAALPMPFLPDTVQFAIG